MKIHKHILLQAVDEQVDVRSHFHFTLSKWVSILPSFSWKLLVVGEPLKSDKSVVLGCCCCYYVGSNDEQMSLRKIKSITGKYAIWCDFFCLNHASHHTMHRNPFVDGSVYISFILLYRYSIYSYFGPVQTQLIKTNISDTCTTAWVSLVFFYDA